MRPGRGRTAAIAAAAAITNQSHHKRSNTPIAGAVNTSSSTTAINKSKQCIVRIEKTKKDETNEKLTTTGSGGQMKRRTTSTSHSTSTSTTSATSTPALQKKGRKQTITEKSPTEKMHVEEDLSDYNLVTARTRRTPKPNPRYNSEDLVKTYSKSAKNEKLEYNESDEEEDFDSADDFEINSNEYKEDMIDSDDDFEEIESKIAKRSKSTPPTLQKGRIKSAAVSGQQKSTENVGGIKRKLENNSKVYTIGHSNKRLNLESNDATDSDTSTSPLNRALRNSVGKTLTSSSSATLDAHRQSLLRPMLRSVQQQQQLQKQQDGNQKGKTIQILERRKENVSSSTSILTSTSTVSTPTFSAIKHPTKSNNNDNDVQLISTGATSTVDDFETMPTFTIVNINDIINKKSDEILKLDAVQSKELQQQTRRKTVNTIITGKNKNNTPSRTSLILNKTSTPINNNVSKLLIRSGGITKSNAPPRILNSVVGKKTRPISPIVNPKEVRKLPSVSTSPSTPTQSQQSSQKQSKENIIVRTITSSSSSLSSPLKPPPPTTTTTTNKNQLLTTQTTNKNQLRTSPSSSTSSTLPSVTRKLPSDRVIVQKQGNKLIKKITCYETWFVINLPKSLLSETIEEDENEIIKTKFDMSLVKLGNNIKEIPLPDNWNYKITLQKLTPAQIKKPNFEPYTGDLNDANILDEDKIKYQPVNIMFRRLSQNSKNRIPFDRAVIFKNQSYFLNIDGKRVRLCNGAPTTIKSIDDIAILLEILNDLSINSEFIENSPFIL